MPTLIQHLVRARLRGWRLVGAAALVLFNPLVGVIALLTGPSLPPDQVAERLVGGFVGGGVFVALGMVALSASTLRDERDDATLGWLALTPRPRWHLGVATVLAAVLACLVLAVVSSVAIAGLGLVTGAGVGPGLATLPASLAMAIGYGSVSATVGYLAPRGLLVMLFYVFVWEGVVATLLPLAANTSMWRISMSVHATFADLPDFALDLMAPIVPGAGGGLAKLLGAGMLATIVLWQVLSHRDLV